MPTSCTSSSVEPTLARILGVFPGDQALDVRVGDAPPLEIGERPDLTGLEALLRGHQAMEGEPALQSGPRGNGFECDTLADRVEQRSREGATSREDFAGAEEGNHLSQGLDFDDLERDPLLAEEALLDSDRG